MALPKHLQQLRHHQTLPLGVQVQIHLINQHHTLPLQWIIQCWIGNGQTPGQITNQGDHAFFAIG
ncbi:hypothetical protein D3C71_1936010 [compost metagenome]